MSRNTLTVAHEASSPNEMSATVAAQHQATAHLVAERQGAGMPTGPTLHASIVGPGSSRHTLESDAGLHSLSVILSSERLLLSHWALPACDLLPATSKHPLQ